jgi:hypothetical protein
MWEALGKSVIGPLIKSWQFARQLEREVVKDDGEPTPQRCVFTTGRRWRKRRCSLDAFHLGEHRFD